jgi:hypothetical protein
LTTRLFLLFQYLSSRLVFASARMPEYTCWP